VKITPDTKVERALYKMLLSEKRENARLKKALAALRANIAERNARNQIRRVSSKLKPHN
jgi:hypothetical protein